MNTKNKQYISDYLDSCKNVCEKTLLNKKYIITNFLKYIEEMEVKYEKITQKNIIDYLNELKKSNKYQELSLQHFRKQIKLFLNWSFKNEIISFSGEYVCPNVNIPYREKLVTSYDKTELKKIIDSIDNTNKIGKLRYVVISMFIYYGIRVSDLINLKFDNIDWKKNQITLIQQKTKNNLVLPLIDEVKYPILDYLKNGRSKSTTDYIFIRYHKPFVQYTTSGIYSLIQKTFEDANISIKNRKHGSHSFRSSLATNLINSNSSLESVRQILCHTSNKSTEQYVRNNTNNLKELSLEIPNE